MIHGGPYAFSNLGLACEFVMKHFEITSIRPSPFFRVYPELYLDVKESLIAESEKCGGLRLAEARRVVKIDVNKTRKLYDFFMAQQLISKPLTPPPSGNGNK